jgi:hypothetical protein
MRVAVPVLLVVSPSFCGAEEVVRAAADTLGSPPLPAAEVTAEASRLYALPARGIAAALFRPPSLFGPGPASRRRAFACFSAALISLLRAGRILYHGPLGPRIVTGVSHAIQARLTASLPFRTALRSRCEGVPENRAAESIRREDAERERAMCAVLGEEAAIPEACDLTIDVSAVGPAAAAEALLAAARNRRYEPMSYSLKAIESLALASRVRAQVTVLDAEVASSLLDGRVLLRTRPRGIVGRRRIERIEAAVRTIEGVTDVRVEYTEGVLGERGDVMR